MSGDVVVESPSDARFESPTGRSSGPVDVPGGGAVRWGSGARPDRSSRCRTTVDGILAIDDGATERILGAHLVVPDASELVAELALAVETGATLEEVAGTIHTHPSLTEVVMEAATAARGEAVHTLK